MKMAVKLKNLKVGDRFTLRSKLEGICRGPFGNGQVGVEVIPTRGITPHDENEVVYVNQLGEEQNEG